MADESSFIRLKHLPYQRTFSDLLLESYLGLFSTHGIFYLHDDDEEASGN
jgi:hypothetical protein